MSPRETRDGAASVKQRLLNLARERGEDFNFLLTRYGVERLLYRLDQSKYAEEFVLYSCPPIQNLATGTV